MADRWDNLDITIEDDDSAGTLEWTSPTNAGAIDQLYASASGNGTTHYLKATNLDLAIPDGITIVGIGVEVVRKAFSGSVVDSVVKLIVDNAIVGNNKASVSTWPSSDAKTTYGGDDDTWGLTFGTTLTLAKVNASNFGIAIAATLTAAVAHIDSIALIIYASNYPPDALLNYFDCDECGFTFKKTKLLKRYDGALVCKWCYEEEHPHDIK